MNTETEIYLGAAKRIFEGKSLYSCCAISWTIAEQSCVYNAYGKERLKYARVFADSYAKLNVEDIMEAACTDKARQNLRVWLLCMMAACCEDFTEEDLLE